MPDQKIMIILTGLVGTGKTELLINMLQWMLRQGMSMPRVIVNDKGAGLNIDLARVTKAVEGIDAVDLLGRCIGCSAREDFIQVVQQIDAEGGGFLLVEPTGLFKLEELERLGDDLPDGWKIRNIHLLSAKKMAAGAKHGLSNLGLCQAIGLTHAAEGAHIQAGLLRNELNKPVVIVERDPSDSTLAQIWELLHQETPDKHGHVSATCEGAGCSHEHHHQHGHAHGHHHHDNQTSFSTQGWTYAELLGWLLSLGKNLIRFKGFVATEDGDRLVQWSDGLDDEPFGDVPVLTASVFTHDPIQPPTRTAFTEAMIEELRDGITPVLMKSPLPDGYDVVNPTGRNAWVTLGTDSAGASPEVRLACGRELIARCREAAEILLDPDHPARLNPQMLGYFRVQTIMVWLHWNELFGLAYEDGDETIITQLLEHIDPDGVDVDRIGSWKYDKRLLPRISECFPNSTDKIHRIQARVEVWAAQR